MYNHAPVGYICPFCLVVDGIENEHVLTKQADIFYRDEYITAFISAHWFGINNGHVLIIPNQHYENIYDLPLDYSYRIHAFARQVALALKQEYLCDGVSTRQHNEPHGNQDVWHYHLHVLPRYKDDKLYSMERKATTAEERAVFADKLRKFFNDD